MKIEIFGTGCPRCNGVEQNLMRAIKQLGMSVEVVKVTDIDQIVERGLMTTPGLAIDGKIVASGRIPSVDEIVSLIKDRQ